MAFFYDVFSQPRMHSTPLANPKPWSVNSLRSVQKRYLLIALISSVSLTLTQFYFSLKHLIPPDNIICLFGFYLPFLTKIKAL